MCYSLWYSAHTMLPAGHWPATSRVHYTTSCNTQSNAPEVVQNNCPKIVELTEIINKPLLLHPFVAYIIYNSLYFLRLANQSPFNPYTEKVENMVSS